MTRKNMAEPAEGAKVHITSYKEATAKWFEENFPDLTLEDVKRINPLLPYGSNEITQNDPTSPLSNRSFPVPPIIRALDRIPPREAVAAPKLQWKNPLLSLSRGRFTYFTNFANLPPELRRKIWFFAFPGMYFSTFPSSEHMSLLMSLLFSEFACYGI